MAPKYHPTALAGGDLQALKKELRRARAMTDKAAEKLIEIAKGLRVDRTKATLMGADITEPRYAARGSKPLQLSFSLHAVSVSHQKRSYQSTINAVER